MHTTPEDTCSKLPPRLSRVLRRGAEMSDQCGCEVMADEMRAAAEFVQNGMGWPSTTAKADDLVRLLDEYHSFLSDRDFTFLAAEVWSLRTALSETLNGKGV